MRLWLKRRALPTIDPTVRVVRGTSSSAILWAALGGLFVVAGFLSLYFRLLDAERAAHYFAPAATLLAATLATMGWVLASMLADRNALRAQTLTVLFTTNFNNELFSKNRRRFDRAFPMSDITNPDSTRENLRLSKAEYARLSQSNNPEDTETADAVRFLANYFEYMAASLILGDLDRTIYFNTIDLISVKYFLASRTMIQEMQAQDSEYLKNWTVVACATINSHKRLGHWKPIADAVLNALREKINAEEKK